MTASKQNQLLDRLITINTYKNGKLPTIRQAVKLFDKLNLWNKFDSFMDRAVVKLEAKGWM